MRGGTVRDESRNDGGNGVQWDDGTVAETAVHGRKSEAQGGRSDGRKERG